MWRSLITGLAFVVCGLCCCSLEAMPQTDSNFDGAHDVTAPNVPAPNVPAPDVPAPDVPAPVVTVWDSVQRVLLLRDYNTRVVVFGTSLLGLATGLVGSFTLLRKRALLGDALSHASLPGVCVAFLVGTWAGLEGKSLPVLLTGAALSGLAGVGSILVIRGVTRLREDAALGIVLSVFFGTGVVLLSVIQQLPTGNAAGLEAYIYGKTASMLEVDARLIGMTAIVCVCLGGLLFKELVLLCFDEDYAATQGYPVLLLDFFLMLMVLLVTVVGLQAVGLVLIIALLITPAAAARFWTHDIRRMVLLASAMGLMSGWLGAVISAFFPKLPSGPMIVLVAAGLFFFSMLCGTARGVLPRVVRQRRLNREIDRQHLLRGIYELLESRGAQVEVARGNQTEHVSFDRLLGMRSWSPGRLRRQLARSRAEGHVAGSGHQIALTVPGFVEAARLVHEHRLWELYLITHAEIAPSRVDEAADTIEHVLGPEMVRQLEDLLEKRQSVDGVVHSPHALR